MTIGENVCDSKMRILFPMLGLAILSVISLIVGTIYADNERRKNLL